MQRRAVSLVFTIALLCVLLACCHTAEAQRRGKKAPESGKIPMNRRQAVIAKAAADAAADAGASASAADSSDDSSEAEQLQNEAAIAEKHRETAERLGREAKERALAKAKEAYEKKQEARQKEREKEAPKAFEAPKDAVKAKSATYRPGKTKGDKTSATIVEAETAKAPELAKTGLPPSSVQKGLAVARQQLTKDALSVRVVMQKTTVLDGGKQQISLVPVVWENDVAEKPFQPFTPKGEEKVEPFHVGVASDDGIFYVFTTDAQLKNKLSFHRPGVFSTEKKVGVEVSNWGEQHFGKIPFLEDGNLEDEKYIAKVQHTATSISLKFSCTAATPGKIVFHLNIVPMLHEKALVAPDKAKSTANQKSEKETKDAHRKDREHRIKEAQKERKEKRSQKNKNGRRLLALASAMERMGVPPPPAVPRFNKLISISFMKDCAGALEVSSSAIPGFVVGTTSSTEDVILDGTPSSTFAVFDDDVSTSMKYLHNVVSLTLYVRNKNYKAGNKLSVRKAIVTVGKPTVLEVTVGGALEAPETPLNHKKAIPLVLNFFCRSAGLTPVTVTLPTSQGDASFSFAKECNYTMDFEGGRVRDLHVGTQKATRDVVLHGITQRKWRTAVSQEALEDTIAEHTRVEVGADELSMDFWVTNNSTKIIKITTPVSIAESVDSTLPVAFPVLKGDLLDKTELQPKSETQFTVVFHCIREGEADVRVRIPLAPAGQMEWTILKTCTEPDRIRQEELNVRVEGFNVGLEGGDKDKGDDVVKNGRVAKPFHWASDTDELYTAPRRQPFDSFTVSYADVQAEKFLANNKNKNSRDTPKTFKSTVIIADQPAVFSQFPIVEPVLSGMASQERQTLEGFSESTLTLTYNCIAKGTTLITVALPMRIDERTMDTNSNPKKRKVLANHVSQHTIILTFRKKCSAARELARSGGGVGFPGLCISTTKEVPCDVVKHGIPATPYFNQRHKSKPEWDDIIVDEAAQNLVLYMSYEHDQGDSYVAYQQPAIQLHDEKMLAELSGDGAQGGMIVNSRDNGALVELDINFKCKYKGLAVVTLTIPLLPHGEIHFSIPKKCGGASPPQGLRISGLIVGTVEHGSDVVLDGQATEPFKPMHSDDTGTHFVAAKHDDTNVFYVERQSKGGASAKIGNKRYGATFRTPPLEIYEPIVFAHRPVCNPQISHTFAHTMLKLKKDSKTRARLNTSWIDGETLQIGSNADTITISYNCLWTGTTPVTVVIPIVPKGQVEFTIQKTCHSLAPVFEEPVDVTQNFPFGRNTATDTEGGGESDGSDGFDSDDAPAAAASSDASEDDDEWDSAEIADRAGKEFASTDESNLNVPFDRSHVTSYIGYVDVGTGSYGIRLRDVVSGGLPHHEYMGDVSRSSGTGASEHVIHATTSEVRYWVSVPSGQQQIGRASAYAVEDLDTGKVICEPRLSGSAALGTHIVPGTPQELTVTFNCKNPGLAPVLISIPLEPHGFVSFRVVKVCSGFKTKVSSAWTVQRVLFMIGSIIFVACGVVLNRFVKNANPSPIVRKAVPMDEVTYHDDDDVHDGEQY